MVALPQQQRDRRLGFSMTPMIDVVFLLIIFFLISSHLSRQESKIELDLPLAQTATHPALHSDARMVVSVSSDGKFWVGAELVTLKMFESKLQASLKKLPDREKDRFEVRIRTGKEQKYQVVQDLMRTCIKNGIWKLKFAVFADHEQT